MTAVLLPSGKQQFLTTLGTPAVGYKLMTWAAGTSTPQATWADAGKVSANTNPITLDVRGEAVIFWDGAYKIQLQDPTGAPVWPPVDNVQSQPPPTGSFIPGTDNTLTLGSAAFSWANIYLGPNHAAAFDPVSGNVGFIARTAAEIAANVTPTFYFYPPGDSRRYSMTGNGVTDDTVASNNFFKVAAGGGLDAKLYPGSYLTTAPLTINLGTLGFSITGASSTACTFTIASTFAGGTMAMQIKGTGIPIGFRLGGFNIIASGGGSGTAVVGLQVGDPSTVAINILGFQFSTIFDVQVSTFATCWQVTHARMIRFQDCAAWNQPFAAQNTCLAVTQNGSFTGDLVFDKFQAVTTNANANTAVTLNSPVGPYNNANGNCQIAGIKFRSCDLYRGYQGARLYAAASSFISDIWFIDGTQFEGTSNQNVYIESNGAGTAIQDIHIEKCYVNSTTTAGISLSCTGAGSASVIESVFIDGNWFEGHSGLAVSMFCVTTGCKNVFVTNNDFVDCNNTVGAAIEVNVCNGINVSGNLCRIGALGFRPNYVVQFEAGTSDIYASGNTAEAGATLVGIIKDNSGATTKCIVNNPGYNPIPATAITVTATPFTWPNNTGAPAIVSLNANGATISALTVAAYAVSSPPAALTLWPVPAGGAVVVTYSGATPIMFYSGL